jgi:hypothetical protein
MIQAIACESGYTNSSVSSATYTISSSCSQDSDCDNGGGYYCDNDGHNDGGGLCTNSGMSGADNTAISCGADTDCEIGYYCDSDLAGDGGGLCTNSGMSGADNYASACGTNLDCQIGSLCNSGTCAVTSAGNSCSEDSDCDAGAYYYCLRGGTVSSAPGDFNGHYTPSGSGFTQDGGSRWIYGGSFDSAGWYFATSGTDNDCAVGPSPGTSPYGNYTFSEGSCDTWDPSWNGQVATFTPDGGSGICTQMNLWE